MAALCALAAGRAFRRSCLSPWVCGYFASEPAGGANNLLFLFDNFLIDTDRRELKSGRNVVHVEPQVFDLLLHFAQNTNRVITKDELIGKVWKGRIVSDAALNSRINAARKAIGDTGEKQALIRTVPRRGFLFAPEVRTPPGDQSTAAPPQHALALPDKPSIAVLPFQNLSSDPQQEYFADGMAEDIITALSRFRWFFVIARNSSFIYKESKIDTRQVGRELGVRYVLEGSVRRDATRLRISVQLVETMTGNHLWGEKYDGMMEDVFDLQDRIAEGVVSAAEPSIRRAEIERARRKRPENLDAYDLYLRALPHAWAFSPEENAKAVPLIDAALRLDSGYAAAHGLAAFCHLRGFAWGNVSETAQVTGVRHARAVLATDTDDATALAFSGLVVGFLEGDSETGSSAIERALVLNPNSAQAFGLGAALYSLIGPFDKVLDYAERSIRLSPFDPLRYVTFNAISRAHFLSARFDEAVEAAQTAIQANAQFAPAYAWLVAANVRLNRLSDARRARDRLVRLDPGFRFAQWAGFVNAASKQKEMIAPALREAGVPE